MGTFLPIRNFSLYNYIGKSPGGKPVEKRYLSKDKFV